MRDFSESFPSIRAFIEAMDSRPVNKVFVDKTLYSQQENKEDGWAGTKTYDDARSLLLNGWTTPLEKFEAECKNIVAHRTQYRPVASVVGYAAIVPNAIVGIPESMISRRQERRKTPTLDIIYNFSICGSVDVDEILMAGARLVKAIQVIEAKGIRVKLDVAIGSESGGQVIACKMPLKRHSDNFNLAKICFPLAHSAMLRRMLFKWIETIPAGISDSYVGGYGRPSDNRTIEKLFPGAKVVNYRSIDCDIDDNNVTELVKRLTK